MRRFDPKGATLEQLINQFIELSVEQDDALLRDNIAKANRLLDRLAEIEHELKTRSGDQRRALLDLYGHPNMNVRLKAAKATLAVAPQSAQAALQDIRDSKWQPQALDAGMCLRAIEYGIFKPT